MNAIKKFWKGLDWKIQYLLQFIAVAAIVLGLAWLSTLT